MLSLKLLELLAKVLRGALRLGQIAKYLADSTSDARIEIDLEALAQRWTRFGVAELTERSHHVDSKKRVAVVEEVFENFAGLPITRELCQAHDSGAAGAGGVPIADERNHVRHRAVIAKRSEAVNRAGTNDVEPAGAIEQIDERIEGRGLASPPEGSRSLCLDKIAGVAQGMRPDGVEGLGRLEVTERFDGRAPHFRVLCSKCGLQSFERLARAKLRE
jgi:hypothetical protein